jgi:hypothetical protein
VISQHDFHDLCWLQAHWKGHYQIWLIDQTWHARRQRQDHGTLTAESAAELRAKMKDDYAELAEAERLTVIGAADGDSVDSASAHGDLASAHGDAVSADLELVGDDLSGAPGPSRAMARARLSRSDQTSLNWLRMHYESHYQIDYLTPARDAACWQAVWRHDGEPGTLVADTAMSLRDMMKGDHARRRQDSRQAEHG